MESAPWHRARITSNWFFCPVEKPRRARFFRQAEEVHQHLEAAGPEGGEVFGAEVSGCPAAVRQGRECSQVAKESRAMFFGGDGCLSRVTDPNPYRSRPRMH